MRKSAMSEIYIVYLNTKVILRSNDLYIFYISFVSFYDYISNVWVCVHKTITQYRAEFVNSRIREHYGCVTVSLQP